MTSSVLQVLKALRKTGSIEEASKLLGMPKERVRLYAYTLASQGLLKLSEPKKGCDCSSCPLRKMCGLGGR